MLAPIICKDSTKNCTLKCETINYWGGGELNINIFVNPPLSEPLIYLEDNL